MTLEETQPSDPQEPMEEETAPPAEESEMHPELTRMNRAAEAISKNELFTESSKAVEIQFGQSSSRQELQQDVASLQAAKTKLQQEQQVLTETLGSLVSEVLGQLEQRKQTLQLEVEKLERRRDRVQQEMRTSFAGVSQDLAIRVQGFRDYLVGSLQDLVSTAEQLDLVPDTPPPTPPERSAKTRSPASEGMDTAPTLPFAEQGFQEQARQIRQLLDQYRTDPDYYGQPWRLRRTFEPIHAKRVANWFFTQGGRGALRTMGSRLQNILIASAIISVLRTLHDRRLCTLVLANTPERLGDWRRGVQDCLGIDRRDFGPDQGIVLFDDANIVAQKADRLVQQGKLPLIIVDDSEDKISLALLQYPLWLAFAPEPTTQPPPIDQF